MKCPYCLESFFENRRLIPLEKDSEGDWGIIADICPTCKKAIFKLTRGQIFIEQRLPPKPIFSLIKGVKETLIKPKAPNRTPLPPQVPMDFAEDYQEACLVLSDSPKASAALSRRCLQNIIREKLGIKKRNLADEIQEVLDNNIFPSYISEPLDAVRNNGNFGAHTIKSTSTGEICPVEPGEAEWNLDVIESLFDFLFVQPAIMQKKKEALNKKLIDAGKLPMK